MREGRKERRRKEERTMKKQKEQKKQFLELKAKEGLVPSVADFRLIRVLGEGGFGTVLLAKKKSSGKLYALKVLEKRNMRIAVRFET